MSPASLASGSYGADDVRFLLTRLPMLESTGVARKEQLIQTGQRHYCELISIEAAPGARYMALFEQAVERQLPRMADDLIRLALAIRARRPSGIVLVSLARAGTPVGVALRRLCAQCMGMDAPHFSISIIRDRGIDEAALDHILAQHPPEAIAFVDGWTGKGAIHAELCRSLQRYNARRRVALAPELFVLADLAGVSAACGSTEDYLIPSAVLNATVCGLVSRTVLNDCIGPGQFHGGLLFEHLRPHDRSRWFIDRLMDAVRRRWPEASQWQPSPADAQAAALRSQALVAELMNSFGVRDAKLIKPGIGESTRALLRRAPRALCLREGHDPQTLHLRVLASERDVPVCILPRLPLRAATIIQSFAHD